MNPKTRLVWLQACAPLTEPEHASWNHYPYNQPPVVKITPHAHLGGDSTWTPTYITEMWSSEVHQDSHIGSATSSCTLDSLQPEAHPCQPSHNQLYSTSGSVLFTYRKSHWDQTRHLLRGIKINNMKTTFLVPDECDPSLFTLILPLPSHLSWSLIMSCLVVFDFWVLNKLM